MVASPPFNTIQHHTTHNTVEHQKPVLIFKQELCCEENISFYSENMLDLRWGCSCDVSDVQTLNITVFYCRTCGWYCFLSDYGSLNCLWPAGGPTFYEHISLNVEPVIFQLFSILFIGNDFDIFTLLSSQELTFHGYNIICGVTVVLHPLVRV